MSIQHTLSWAHEQLQSTSPSAHLDAELLLLHAINGPKQKPDRSWLIAHHKDTLTEKQE